MKAFPFPLSDGTSFPPSDGYLVKCPSFLKTLSAQPYQRLFASLGEEERLYTDPVGFSVMPVHLDGKKHFIVGVRVDGFYDQKKTKAKIGSDFNPVFPLEAFIDTLTRSRASTQTESATAGNVSSATESAQFVQFTMHEIRRLNLDVKAQAEEMTANLNRGAVDRDFLDYRAQNIFGTSSLISIRLNSYDFHVNPNALMLGEAIPIEIFKKFDKTKHCLQVECRRRQVQIRLDGNCRRSIQGYPIFELLPFVLLENAIKYSPPDQGITISFVEDKKGLEVIVTSIGPRLSDEEHKLLFQRDFRGANAKKTNDGSGAGLHFAKLVCDLHKVQISARSLQQEILRLKGVPYSYFTVNLEFR
jgi:Histidine kinase-, DNA gyrase B-, and HSP90-like ATPase